MSRNLDRPTAEENDQTHQAGPCIRLRYGDEIDETEKLLICRRLMERATGIEPVSEAWEASVLPLY